MNHDRELSRADALRDVLALMELTERLDLRWANDPAVQYPPELAGACGRGWLPLVERLVQSLLALGWNREVGQIGQVYGTLVFFVREPTAAMRDLIEQAELESFATCERCGRPGRIGTRLPLTVRCPEHEAAPIPAR